jgi:drug/metabolite transporter (DMT)-like permease
LEKCWFIRLRSIEVNSAANALVPARQFSPLILCCLAATWLIWGSTYLAIRFALVGFPPFFLMATRFICAGGLLMQPRSAWSWEIEVRPWLEKF